MCYGPDPILIPVKLSLSWLFNIFTCLKKTLISNHTYFYSFILCALAWFSKFQKSTDKQNNNNKLMTRAAELARRHKNYVYRFPYEHPHIFTKLNSCFIKTIWFLCNDVRVVHESDIATHPLILIEVNK